MGVRCAYTRKNFFCGQIDCIDTKKVPVSEDLFIPILCYTDDPLSLFIQHLL